MSSVRRRKADRLHVVAEPERRHQLALDREPLAANRVQALGAGPGSREVDGPAKATVRSIGELDGGTEIRDAAPVDLEHRRLLPHQLALVGGCHGPADAHVHHPLEQFGGSRAARELERLVAGEVPVPLVDRLQLGLGLESRAGHVVLEAELLEHDLATSQERLELHDASRSRRYSSSRPPSMRSCTSVSRSRTVTV
jgi:hypothetical protein